MAQEEHMGDRRIVRPVNAPDTVDLRLMRRRNGTLYWELRVRSEVKPRVKKIGTLEFEKGSNQGPKISALGGAMAEELCEEYSDTLEPSAVARGAASCYADLMAEPAVAGIGDEEARDPSSKFTPATRLADHRRRH